MFRAAVDQEDPLVKLFNDVLNNGWKKANKPFGTYSFIALPPEMRFSTDDEARAWAKEVIRILNKSDPNVNGGKAPLHRDSHESGHLIISKSGPRDWDPHAVRDSDTCPAHR